MPAKTATKTAKMPATTARPITRQTPIGELVMNHLSSVEVLLSHGFHCIGCGLSAYETVEEGALAHGFDDAAIDKLVEELNEAAKKDSAQSLLHVGQKSVAEDKNAAVPLTGRQKKKPAKKTKRGV